MTLWNHPSLRKAARAAYAKNHRRVSWHRTVSIFAMVFSPWLFGFPHDAWYDLQISLGFITLGLWSAGIRGIRSIH